MSMISEMLSIKKSLGPENYNLFLRNCTTQASKWLGMPFVNNPGTFANNITGNVPYYNSFSITGPLLW